MAKGGKGRKGGGGGGKTRKYSRDNNGRFAATGTGATARGGRLLTAKGNKRTARALAGKTKTIEAAGKKGVLAKPQGLKQQSPATYGIAKTKTAKKEVNDRLTKKYSTLPDQATVNIPGRFSGQAGKRFNASIDRAVATVAADKKAQFKTSSEVKATTTANKAAAKPKRVRSAESLRVSRAKQVEKRRSITTNPAGVRASAAAKMAANATRTQERAAAFYKAGGKQPAAKPSAASAAAKPATRKDQLAAGAKKRTAQADRIDAKVKKLESEYRGKDAAFYTQGAKPAGRDRMIAKSQKAAQLREESISLRSKAANAERMSNKIKDKPIKSSGGNKRLDRAIKNEAAGSTSYKRNPKGYKKRIAALTAQKVYQTGDPLAGLSLGEMTRKGFRVPRNQRQPAKPAAPKAASSPKGRMRATKRVPLAPDSASANRLSMFKSDKQLTDQRTKSLRAGLKKETDPVQKIKFSSSISESQLKSKSYGDNITRMQARPIMGKRTGVGRGNKPVSGPAAKRAGVIKGKVKRNPKAASKAPKALNLNAGKYKNIYIDRANTKGKAAAKAAKRTMR